MKNLLFTGVSGCGRIEFLEEVKRQVESKGKSINLFDIGGMIFDASKELGIHISDEKILDIDRNLLVALRRIAFEKVKSKIVYDRFDINLIGLHVTFRWKGRLIDGINFNDLKGIRVDGIYNVVDDVKIISEALNKNTKWTKEQLPSMEITNSWIMEEEFVSKILSQIMNVPFYVVGRNHNINNLVNLLSTQKRKIYLSYPITKIEEEDPGLLKEIQDKFLPKLEEEFIVFNPLVIKDIEYANSKGSELSLEAKELIRGRTIARDYQFIDQSDFVVVVYLTEKASPGVSSEIEYAGRHSKEVYMVHPYSKSPFLTENVTKFFDNIDSLIEYLSSEEFRKKNFTEEFDFGIFKEEQM